MKLLKDERIRHKGNSAFSLVEMLMALLVASLLLAALAPVITRRLGSDNVNLVGNLENDKVAACGYVNDSTTDMDRECLVPSDAASASAIIVSAGGGGGAATKSVDDGSVYVSTTYRGTENAATSRYNRKNYYYTVTKDMSDLEFELVSSGSGGGRASASGGYPANQADCGSWGIYVKPEQNCENISSASVEECHGTCVSKYNPGEGRTGSPDIPSGVQKYPADSTASATECDYRNADSLNCCWYGNNNTSYATSTDCSAKDGYSGCFRTVCQWNAANEICTNWKPITTAGVTTGRMPKVSEFRGWAQNLNVVSDLMLCSSRDGSYAKCANMSGCKHIGNSSNTYCWPQVLWANDRNIHHVHETGMPMYYYAGFGSSFRAPTLATSDATGTDYNSGNYANSVRCVIDKISAYQTTESYGGTAGSYVKVKIPNDLLKKMFRYKPVKNADGIVVSYEEAPVDTLKLQFAVGNGGSGATASQSNVVGSSTVLMIYRGDETEYVYFIAPYWPYTVDMMQGCHYLNEYNDAYKEYGYRNSCIDIDTVVFHKGGELGGTGGASGKAYWDGVYGGREDNTPGSGGIGGKCTEGRTRLTHNCTDGSSGTPGAARFTYKIKYPGIGGSGGNAGSLLHIKNIAVQPNSIIKAHIGKAGSGGVSGDGLDGGNSWIELSDGKKYEVIGGKAGRAGTPANPLAAGAERFAKAGKARDVASGDIITSATKTLINKLHGDFIYPDPDKAAEIASLKGQDAPENTNMTIQKTAGGNGGINSKISGLAGLKGIPCGAYSTSKIKINSTEYTCGSKSLLTEGFDPMPLRRSLTENDLTTKALSYAKSYAPGATGGGGGAWSNDFLDGKENAGQGADGMGGYVLIYFNK